jgi:two-component system, OmpR family, sensor histidine kinase CreC
MSLRLRLLVLMLTIYAAGGYFITRWIVDQVRPRYLESMEETLVDTSVLLATVVEQKSPDTLSTDVIRRAYVDAEHRAIRAQIFSLTKAGIDLRVYVTDGVGRVVFDSTGRHEGADFSRWNDVARTLQGRYGARSTRDVPGDDETQVIYVAAPIRRGDQIVGAVSVGKPTHGINTLVAQAKHRIVIGAVTGGGLLLGLLLLAMSWVIAPLERLIDYARAVRDGRAATLPPLPGRTLHELGTAFEQMRDALEGRQHAERYTQALAHEVKAPLAAIRGAAELLEEEMPPDQRQIFLANIRNEGARIQHIVERLLELSSIEARKALARVEPIDISSLLEECVGTVGAAYSGAGVRLEVTAAPSLQVHGDPFLLRQALVNLLQNALDFSPRATVVRLSARPEKNRVLMTVEDSGPGVPDYALAKVFDRFYSLPRPGGTRKSTGIGLALVREIAHLHGGEATLSNRPEGGAQATFWIPGDVAASLIL